LIVGLLLGAPDNHLATTLWIFLDPDREGIALFDAEILPHVLWDRNTPTDAD
jgi:hypothetical protein